MKRILIATVLLIFLTGIGRAQKPEIVLDLKISNNQGAMQTVFFGLDPDATAKIDTALGENELPPLPPQGIFDARFVSSELQQVDLGQGSYTDLRPGDVSFSGLVEYELRYQSNVGDSIYLSWNLPDSISGSIEDIFGGTMLKKEFTGSGELVVEQPNIFDKLKLKVQFKAVAQKPGNPEQLFPAANAEDIALDPELVWKKASNAESYNLECYLVGDALEKVFTQSGIVDTVFKLPVLAVGEIYEWRVQASNHGLQSEWISRRFTTKTAVLQAPKIPVALWPDTNATSVPLSPNLSWRNQDDCDSFDLQVYFAGSFSQLIVDETMISDTVFQIENLQAGAVYFWRLRAVNNAGQSDWSELIQFKTRMPNAVESKKKSLEFKFYANYPNPFNPVTNLEFSLDRSSYINLKIYDVRGRLVVTLVDEYLMPGKYRKTWNAGNCASGKYFAVLVAGEHRFIQSLSLLK